MRSDAGMNNICLERFSCLAMPLKLSLDVLTPLINMLTGAGWGIGGGNLWIRKIK